MTHASDSSIQGETEAEILSHISANAGVVLSKRRVDLPGGTWVEVDGVDDDLSVFVEAFAHQGAMKGGQKRKVALDVLKLITVGRQYPDASLVLGFCDPAAKDSLTGWLAEAIEIWEVEIAVVPIDQGLRARLTDAQTRQFR